MTDFEELVKVNCSNNFCKYNKAENVCSLKFVTINIQHECQNFEDRFVEKQDSFKVIRLLS